MSDLKRNYLNGEFLLENLISSFSSFLVEVIPTDERYFITINNIQKMGHYPKLSDGAMVTVLKATSKVTTAISHSFLEKGIRNFEITPILNSNFSGFKIPAGLLDNISTNDNRIPEGSGVVVFSFKLEHITLIIGVMFQENETNLSYTNIVFSCERTSTNGNDHSTDEVPVRLVEYFEGRGLHYVKNVFNHFNQNEVRNIDYCTLDHDWMERFYLLMVSKAVLELLQETT